MRSDDEAVITSARADATPLRRCQEFHRPVPQGRGSNLRRNPMNENRERCPYTLEGGELYCGRPWCGVCARNRRRDEAPSYEAELLAGEVVVRKEKR